MSLAWLFSAMYGCPELRKLIIFGITYALFRDGLLFPSSQFFTEIRTLLQISWEVYRILQISQLFISFRMSCMLYGVLNHLSGTWFCSGVRFCIPLLIAMDCEAEFSLRIPSY